MFGIVGTRLQQANAGERRRAFVEAAGRGVRKLRQAQVHGCDAGAGRVGVGEGSGDGADPAHFGHGVDGSAVAAREIAVDRGERARSPASPTPDRGLFMKKRNGADEQAIPAAKYAATVAAQGKRVNAPEAGVEHGELQNGGNRDRRGLAAACAQKKPTGEFPGGLKARIYTLT